MAYHFVFPLSSKTHQFLISDLIFISRALLTISGPILAALIKTGLRCMCAHSQAFDVKGGIQKIANL